MRFAGHRIEDYFAGPNMGKLVGGAEQINAREKTAGIQAQAQVASSSIYGDATKEAGELIGAAEAAAGRDAMWGSIFNTVGQVGGAAIGKFGSGIGKGAEFGEVGTSGSDMAAFGYTPEQDRLFNSGVGIDYGYL